MTQPGNAAALDQLRADILNQNTCAELAASATQLVMGYGNPQSDIVFIGEAPGKNEDLQGKPFIGAAGKFLDTMLAEANLVREDIYITNIVKYRPPANRDPKPDEKKAFWPFLVRELQIIQPSIIVTLGRHSMEYFLPGLKITDVHGQPKRVVFGDRKLVIMPLYHPAAALYNGDLKATLLEDFAKVPGVLDAIHGNTAK
jgi:uracil-DNA glycosylase family 4